MTSSGNYPTFNPLVNTGQSLTHVNGNLEVESGSFWSSSAWARMTLAGFGGSTGKYYAEFVNYGSSGGGSTVCGIGNYDSLAINTTKHNNAIIYYYTYILQGNTQVNIGGNYSSAPGISGNEVLRMAWDCSNGKVWLGGSQEFFNVGSGVGDPANGTNPSGTISTYAGAPIGVLHNRSTNTGRCIMNFGQNGDFSGTLTAQNNTDENGDGNFYYSVPAGFLALNTKNLFIDSDIDPAQTNDDYVGGKQFGIVTYTGNSTTGQAITGLGFKPDVIWAKCSSHSQNNQVFHSQVLNSRSPTPTPYMFQMDTTSRISDTAQGNNNPMISSFDTDGFTLGSSGSGPNDNGRTYVAWCWRAKGATTTTNNDGDRTSTIQVNADIGFSTGTYTGNLSGSGTATVGHGLGKAPEMIISFRSDGNSQRILRHANLSSEDHVLQVETTGAETSKSHNGNMSAPNATTFDTNYTDGLNTNGHTFLFMAWTSIPGFSKFGSYVGNGNADGTFIYTGFKPKMIMIRRYTGTDSLFVYDSARSPHNVMGNFLQWNDSAAQTGSNLVDFLSNGFKMRSTSASQNPSGTTIIYAAWADVPAKYSNAF